MTRQNIQGAQQLNFYMALWGTHPEACDHHYREWKARFRTKAWCERMPPVKSQTFPQCWRGPAMAPTQKMELRVTAVNTELLREH